MNNIKFGCEYKLFPPPSTGIGVKYDILMTESLTATVNEIYDAKLKQIAITRYNRDLITRFNPVILREP
jgi:hypothetical protein